MPFLLILSLFLLMLLLEFDIEAATRVMGRHPDFACMTLRVTETI